MKIQTADSLNEIAYLTVNNHHRFYNHRVIKALEAASIPFKLLSTEKGYRVMVSDADYLKGAKTVLSVPFK